jgi:hypothetical protein
VCGAETALPPELAALALSFAEPGSVQPEDVEVGLRCALQAHSDGEHHAFVLQLDGIDAGAVWTSWTERPTAVEVRADCGAVSPREHGSQPCCEFDGHPGAHTYETYDRWAIG